MTRSDWTQERVERAFAGLLNEETLRGLKKRGVKDVQVVTRKSLFEAIRRLAEESPTKASPSVEKSTIQKRIELQLIEIERLRKEKSETEHQKGLLETERADLRGKLDMILNSVQKAVGEKVTVEDVQAILRERDDLRDENGALRSRSEIARESYEEQITNLRVEVSGLEGDKIALNKSLEEARSEISRLREDLEASRSLAANHARKKLELEEQLGEAKAEVTTLKETVEAKDKEIEDLKNPPEEEAEDDSAVAPPPLGRRAPTRRMARPRPGPRPTGGTTRTTRKTENTTSLGFTFASGTPRGSRPGSRRRRKA